MSTLALALICFCTNNVRLSYFWLLLLLRRLTQQPRRKVCDYYKEYHTHWSLFAQPQKSAVGRHFCERKRTQQSLLFKWKLSTKTDSVISIRRMAQALGNCHGAVYTGQAATSGMLQPQKRQISDMNYGYCDTVCSRKPKLNKWVPHTRRLTAIFPGLPRWAATRKVKPIWILLKQKTVSGSGIS